jgi:serralysin
MPATTTYATTGNAYIDGLLGDWKWAIKDFTFSFPTSASFYGAGYGNGEPLKGFAVLNAAQQAATRAAFDQFSSVANVTFTEVTESATKHADLRLASSDAPSTAWAYFPSTAAEGGDAWFNKSSGHYSRPIKGNYAHVSFLHEIGHALGLEHAHEGNVMPVNRDSMEYTVMSYRSYVGASTTTGYTNETWGYAQSLMMYDIAALQHMYGADFTTESGNTTYRWSPTSGEMFINGIGEGAPGGNKILLTVWDGGGTDTYDFSNYTTALKVDLRPGEWTTTSAAQLAKLHYNGSKVAIGNIANALQFQGDARSLIENAKGGTGSDTITGNAAANALWGNGGNDRLIGGDGNDNLFGGAGADRLDGGNGTDLANYSNATAGVVADLSSPASNTGEAAGDTYVSIERLYGSAFNDTVRGDNGANLLNGLAGNDVLNGRDGNDTLIGGNGADRLIGGGGADTFVFQTTAQSAPAARDVIDDFASGIDRMDLRSIDANSNAIGDQAFLFIGSSAFHGKAGELNFRSGIVSGDVNGDGLAEFQIKVTNLSALSGSDFLL